MFEGAVLIAPDLVHSVKEERFKAIGAGTEGAKDFHRFRMADPRGRKLNQAGERSLHAAKGGQSL